MTDVATTDGNPRFKNHGDAPSRSRLMKVLLAGRATGGANQPCRCAKHPSFKYIPSVKEERFRAFLGVPIIQRRQLLGVLVVQQRELRQYDESEESFLVTLATQMAAILSQSQLAALLGSIVIPASARFRPRRASRLPKAGWMPRSR